MSRGSWFLVRPGLALVLIGVAGIVPACSGSASSPGLSPELPQQTTSAPPAPGAPSAAAATSASLEGIAAHLTLDELQHLREKITLGTWKTLHSTDTLELYSSKLASYPNETWCARMVSELLQYSDRKVKRTAYFYLPAEPDAPALPSNVRQEELVSECRLGFVWTEVEDADSTRAEAFAEALRESIKADLGSGEMDVKLNWIGSANWRRTALWENGTIEIASAATFGLGSRSPIPAAIVGAASDISGIGFRSVDARTLAAVREKYVARHRPIWSRIEEALSIAELGGQAEASFRAALKLVTASDGWWSRSPTDSEQSAIFDAVDQWLITSGPLPPARRSAALFAADQLFQESRGPRWREGEDPPIRQRLEAQGARFEWAHLGDSYFYTHTWLREALLLDPDGRAGELAFLTLMEMGFETSAKCEDQHGEGFRAVVAQGQEYIRRRPASAIAPDLRFLIAQAYGDIVALAAGSAYTDPDRNEYQLEAASARMRAIEEFRIAFASSNSTPRARESWPEAWRLVAGLPPGKMHFYCIYE